MYGIYVGGIYGDTGSPVVRCVNYAKVKGIICVGGIIGRKTGDGTHYIENYYWPTEFNINALSNPNETNFSGNYGNVEINEKTTAYEKTFMQSQEFVNILNNYVTTYNEEYKEDADFVELLTWELDLETKYPTLNFD